MNKYLSGFNNYILKYRDSLKKNLEKIGTIKFKQKFNETGLKISTQFKTMNMPLKIYLIRKKIMEKLYLVIKIIIKKIILIIKIFNYRKLDIRKFKNVDYIALIKKIKESNYKGLPKKCYQLITKYKNKFLTLKRTKQIIIILGIIFVAVIIPVSYNVYLIKSITIYSNKAEEYYYKGEFDKAILEYKKILDKDNNYIWYSKIAEIYSLEGNKEESNAYLDKAAGDKNKSIELWCQIIFTKFENQDFEGALKTSEEAIKLNPNNKFIVKYSVPVLIANNKINEAKNIVNNYPVDKSSSYDIVELASLYILCGDYGNGFDKLKEAWMVDKDEFKVFDVISQLAAYNKDDIIVKINDLKTKDNSPLYDLWLAKIYSMSSESAEQGQLILKNIEDKDVGKLEINAIKATILRGIGEKTEGDALMQSVVKDNMGNYRANHIAAWYYFNNKDYVKAEECARKSIVQNKYFADNYGFLMPEILKANNHSNMADAYFRRAMYLEPYNYRIILNKANYTWANGGNLDKVLSDFKLAESIKPNEGEINFNIAQIYVASKKIPEAIDILNKCVAIDPSSVEYRRMLGTLYLIGGKNPSEAKKSLNEALNLNAVDIITLNNVAIAQIYIDGNIENSFATFQKAYNLLNNNPNENTKKIVISNFTKIRDFYNVYKSGKGGEGLKVPSFDVLY